MGLLPGVQEHCTLTYLKEIGVDLPPFCCEKHPTTVDGLLKCMDLTNDDGETFVRKPRL
jgi:hypothetical protein